MPKKGTQLLASITSLQLSSFSLLAMLPTKPMMIWPTNSPSQTAKRKIVSLIFRRATAVPSSSHKIASDFYHVCKNSEKMDCQSSWKASYIFSWNKFKKTLQFLQWSWWCSSYTNWQKIWMDFQEGMNDLNIINS